MADDLKQGYVSFSGDKPMQLTEDCGDNTTVLTPDQRGMMNLVGETVRAYLEAARDLLSGKYSHLREFAPEYLANPGNVMVITCAGGTVIRYEKKQEISQVFTGWMTEDLRHVAAMLSQNLIQCYPSRQFLSTVETTGIEFKLSSVNPDT